MADVPFKTFPGRLYQKNFLSYFTNVTSSNVLNEKTKKLFDECFIVSKKRPKYVLIESLSDVHRVTSRAHQFLTYQKKVFL